ncbi:MAG: tRNA (adenosine(37)-N6)-dimethylallyltransferase MiaA [Clostridia bacterium]|nr:tRNA (adenosine(37)-N6)-dimethylallyltransferase MiaA [Clostridia bacterium]
MIPLIIIAGPTASGKTALSVEIAKAVGGEILSADSMQIYKYMDIGTAKPTLAERQGVPHHLMDMVHPTEDFSLADYCCIAHKTIADIYNRGKFPIMVGGTGLYIDTVEDNIILSQSQGDEELRKSLELFAKEKGNKALHQMLKPIDRESYEKLHENDVKRIIRAIEVYKTTGQTISFHNKKSRNGEKLYKSVRLMFDYDREVLYERINKRVDIMLKEGLEQEVRNLLDMGITRDNTAMQAIGYKEMAEYIVGDITLDEAVEKIKMESRRYAKRQISWFKRKEYNLLSPCENAVEKALEIIKKDTL